jgi:Tol biopolymer transport system component
MFRTILKLYVLSITSTTLLITLVVGISQQMPYTEWEQTAYVELRSKIVMMDNRTLHRIIVHEPGYRTANPAWSFDGTKLAYLRFDAPAYIPSTPSTSDVFHISLLDGKIHHLMHHIGTAGNLKWNPTGDKLSYLLYSPDRGYEMILLNPFTKEMKTLASEFFGKIFYKWSPDGKKIAFITADWVEQSPLYIFDIETHSIIFTSKSQSYNAYTSFDWAPNSRQIVVSRGSSEHQTMKLYILDIENETEVLLPNWEGSQRQAVWSPDGIHIAFVSNTRLYLTNTLNWQAVELGNGNLSNPSWSLDGRSIVYNMMNSDTWGPFFAVNIDGTQVRRVSDVWDGISFRPRH